MPDTIIVNFGMGNLFSVKHACEAVGLVATITSEKAHVLAADAVILPGVGAFGDAMKTLHSLDLVEPLKDFAASGKPLLGICLGLQLLMTESHEFGRHKGLSLVNGPVVRFEKPLEGSQTLKVPHVGWNAIRHPDHAADGWNGTLLEGLVDGEPMYFIHSYHAQPTDPSMVLCVSTYGHITFCSGLRKQNIHAMQFHPERSGTRGLQIYRNFAALIRQN